MKLINSILKLLGYKLVTLMPYTFKAANDNEPMIGNNIYDPRIGTDSS